ncbi:MAG: hypothetical protein MMC33_007651 [Icmadophila ericetorum]|nr:hypothetical protein [Icmadophila ericetorum]
MEGCLQMQYSLWPTSPGELSGSHRTRSAKEKRKYRFCEAENRLAKNARVRIADTVQCPGEYKSGNCRIAFQLSKWTIHIELEVNIPLREMVPKGFVGTGGTRKYNL